MGLTAQIDGKKGPNRWMNENEKLKGGGRERENVKKEKKLLKSNNK